MYSERASFPDSAKDRIWFWTKEGELHIDGGGVDVQVVEANIGASNGVIHSINKVYYIKTFNLVTWEAFSDMQVFYFDI